MILDIFEIWTGGEIKNITLKNPDRIRYKDYTDSSDKGGLYHNRNKNK